METEDDFSDFDFQKIVDEELEEFYCICKAETSSKAVLIECEGPDCKTKFFHPRCVGLKNETGDGPSDWMCHECLGLDPPMKMHLLI